MARLSSVRWSACRHRLVRLASGHKAKAVVQSAVIGGVFNAAGAILNAASKLGPGDIILIELHAKGGPDNRYIAMQFWDAVFAAIKTAVGMGIVVVEAAGNGDEDFNRPEYAGTGLQKDAGAIALPGACRRPTTSQRSMVRRLDSQNTTGSASRGRDSGSRITATSSTSTAGAGT